MLSGHLSSICQPKTDELRSVLQGKSYLRASNALADGFRDFYLLEKACDGLFLIEDTDSCKHIDYEDVFFVPQPNGRMKIIIYDNCGKLVELANSSEAIRLFSELKDVILKEQFKYEVFISHTCSYRFLEFRNARMNCYVEIYPEAIQRDPNEESRALSQQLATWKFFFDLRAEIDSYIEDSKARK
jgi:hypothetical protein